MAGDGPPPTGVELNTSSILNATNATDRECEELSASQRAELPLFDPQRLKDPTYARVELYCAATLIFVCAVSVLNNACVLLSTCWIKRRPLSTTMRISLSLTGADTTASFFLGVSWFINNILHQMVPPAPDTFKPMSVGGRCMLVAPERLTCLILALEALRLGAVLVTMLHLLALAANHYLGALRPLQSHVRHAYLVVGLAAIWIVPEATLFVYFSSFEGDGFRTEGSQCGYEFLKTYNFHITFSLIFFFVLVLMICIYVHIYIIVQRHERNRHRFRRTGSSHQRAELKHLNGATHKQAQAEWGAEVEAQAQEPNGGTHSSNSLIATSLLRTTRSRRGGSPQFRRNKKAIVTTLYILGSYLIGWMPAVVSFMLVCDKECAIPRETLAFDSVYTVLVFWSFNMLIVIKTLANSFIYTSRMKEIKEARHSMCNALARRCCRFLPQSTDPVRGALFGGAPTESTQQPVRSERLSVYSHSRNSTRRLNGLAHGQGRRRDQQLAQSDV